MTYAKSTESNSSLLAELKKVTQELASHKIELHQTRAYLRCILQNCTELIFATDAEGVVVSFSKGGEKVLGYAFEKVVGRPVKTLAQDPESFGPVIDTCQQEGCALALEVPFRHKEGKTVYCNVSLMDLTNREGQRVGTVGICQDITRRKKLQEDLIQVDRLAEIGRIAAGVAHEINNPLAVINEASGWAGEVVSDARGLSSDERRELEEAVKKISAHTMRCSNITHKLLAFARKSAPTKREFDIHEVLKETIDFLTPELKHTSIEIDFNFAGGALSVNSDPRLLEQVFVNFITNAIHAVLEKAEDEKRIEIQTLKTNSEIEISVKDNGVGIPEEHQVKIFDLFYSTKPPGKGTGLGLSICQNIVRKLEGDITLESKVGVGTTFTIRIPIS
ncbi:MAG: PAS domain S-box protein [Desulfobacterales bacterium]|nr:PAS domain S-box protein [Desulfobacterales bacterium]